MDFVEVLKMLDVKKKLVLKNERKRNKEKKLV